MEDLNQETENNFEKLKKSKTALVLIIIAIFWMVGSVCFLIQALKQ